MTEQIKRVDEAGAANGSDGIYILKWVVLYYLYNCCLAMVPFWIHGMLFIKNQLKRGKKP